MPDNKNPNFDRDMEKDIGRQGQGQGQPQPQQPRRDENLPGKTGEQETELPEKKIGESEKSRDVDVRR